MILKTLTLKNYRRFKKLQLDFQDNITLFTGKNGSGKTTIFEAILYALFGTQMVRTAKEDIKADFADQKQECQVSLTFELEGKQYKIERSIKGRGSVTSAFIFTPDQKDKPVAERESGVNKYIQNLLGMNSTTFKISVFSAQKELDKFSSLKPEERKEEIRRLLKIDTIKKAITLLRKDIRDNETRIEALKSQQRDMSEIKSNIKQLENDLAQQELTLEKFINDSLSLKSKLGKQKDKVKDLEKLSQTANNLDKQLIGLKSNLRALKENIDRETDKIIDLTKKKKQLTKLLPIKQEFNKTKGQKKLLDLERDKYQQLKSLKDQLEEEKKDGCQLNQQCIKINEQIKKLLPAEGKEKNVKKQLSETEEKINGKNLVLTKIKQQEEQLKNKFNEVNQKLEKIKKLGKKSPCPTCTQILGKYYDDLLLEFSKEAKNIQKEIKDKRQEYLKEEIEKEIITKQKQNFEQQVEELNKQVKQLDAFRANTESISEQISNSNKKVNILIHKINQVGKVDFEEEKYQQFINKYELLEKQNETVIKLEVELKELPKAIEKKRQFIEKQQLYMNQLTGVDKKRKSLNFDEQEFDQERKTLEQLQEEHENTSKKVIESKGFIQTTKVDLKNNQEKLKTQKELEKEINRLLTRNRIIGTLEPLLQDFEKDLLIRIRPVLEKEASNLLHIITKGKYSDIELDQNYEIRLYDKGEKYKIKRFSGGEEDLINLCLRLAISRVIAEKSGARKISFLILDEIFASQDEDRQENILQTLQGLSTQFRQLFLITHVSGIKDAMPIVYEVSEISEHESNVKLLY